MPGKPGTPPSALEILHRLARLLESAAEPVGMINRALEILATGRGTLRASLTMLNPETGQIQIEAAWGLKPAQQKRGVYMRGEGITGAVVASGQPALVEDISHSSQFLNRTRSRDSSGEKLAFICVPIIIAGQTFGALAIDRQPAPLAQLQADMKFLGIVAGLLGPAALKACGDMEQKPKISRAPGFVGSSPAMLHVYDQIGIVAPSHATVLLQGESGVGKELAARAIHQGSPRAGRPFVALNCAALPETLIESELFGHERGAFTGAAQMRRGRFEQANGGTLFLDEIGELSALVQAKLLRVLQEGSFERLGGMESISTDARLIAASNRDLAAMVEAGAFRRDLFYRLNVFPIRLPPLRERKEDILPLASHFLEHFTALDGGQKPRLSLAAMTLLENYEWPGNIRELQNAMERAALLLGRDNLVLPGHLPPLLHAGQTGDAPGARTSPGPIDLEAMLAEVEHGAICGALEGSGGHMGKTARLLGLTPRVLGLRMAKYGLDYKTFRRKPAPKSGHAPGPEREDH